MSYVEYTSHYVGHGAMNYFRVFDDEGYLEKKILIDAGSNCDLSGTKEATKRFHLLREEIMDSEEDQCIFCLTHPHDDHFSYLVEYLNMLRLKECTEIIDKFYVGGDPELLDWDTFFLLDLDDYGDVVSLWRNVTELYNDDRAVVLPHFATPRLLWQSSDANVKLYALYNDLIHSSDTNDHSASFVVKNEESKNMVWVTGDSTGSVFNYYLDHDQYTSSIANILAGGNEVYITAPHHGSIHSLDEAKFVRDEDGYLTSAKWEFLCSGYFGVTKYRLILGSCPWDKYNHPNGMALCIFFSLCEDAEINYGWDIYEDEMVDFLMGEVYEKASPWYRQYINKFVIPTARGNKVNSNYDYSVSAIYI